MSYSVFKLKRPKINIQLFPVPVQTHWHGGCIWNSSKFCLLFCYLLIAPKWRKFINTRRHTKEKTIRYIANRNLFCKIGKEIWPIGWAKYVYVALCSEICAKGFCFCVFSLWLKNIKNRSKYPCFQWPPFRNLIPKKENNCIFQKKIIWTTQKRYNFA